VKVEAFALPRGIFARRRLWGALASRDVVVLHRTVLGEADLVGLRRKAKALVLDMDDAIQHRPSGVPGGRGLRKKFELTVRACDVVICGNLHLRDEVRRRHPRVRLLPPASFSPPEVPERTGEGPVRLVWTGSGATLRYLEGLAPVLSALGDAVEVVVLADVPPKLPGASVRFVPWTLEAEEQALAEADVGLYPAEDDPWSQGKCAYKLHRYMHFGLPSVASPHGAGREVLGEGGLLAEGPEAWEAALRQLVADPGLRRAMGQAARARALAELALPDRTQSLAQILQEAAAIGRLRAGGEI
jgi:hypothetical protein